MTRSVLARAGTWILDGQAGMSKEEPSMTTKHYDECYFVNYDSYDDLNFYEVGCQKCPPGYSFGPIIRDNYVLHYVLSGEGKLYLNDKEYPVSEKQVFVLPPNFLVYYKGSKQNPWNYIWIHFNGKKAIDLLSQAGITSESPVLRPVSPSPELENCMLDMLHYNNQEYRCIGDLYQLFQLLIAVNPNKPETAKLDKSLRYVKNVISFISKKYSEPIKIQEIADFYGLDRSYLCKIFKHATNYTLQEYLIFFRIKKARQLLKNPELPIQHIAYTVGYRDPFAFSKVFKKETGMSPSDYRAQHLNSQD